MKIENVSRAASLASALTALESKFPKAFAELPKIEAENTFSDQFQISLGVPFAANSIGAPAHKALTFIDVKTGKLICDAAAKIVRAELTAMGVEL